MDNQMANMLVGGIMNEISEFLDFPLMEVHITPDEGNVVLWTVKFSGMDRSIAGIVDVSLEPKSMKHQILASVMIGMHPMGDSIGQFIYAQQVAKQIPETFQQAMGAQVYYFLKQLVKMVKPTALKQMFLQEIKFDEILKIIVDEQKKARHH